MYLVVSSISLLPQRVPAQHMPVYRHARLSLLLLLLPASRYFRPPRSEEVQTFHYVAFLIQYENALLASSDSPQRCCRCKASLSRSRKLADQLHSSAVMLPWSPDFPNQTDHCKDSQVSKSGWCQVLLNSSQLHGLVIFLFFLPEKRNSFTNVCLRRFHPAVWSGWQTMFLRRRRRWQI